MAQTQLFFTEYKFLEPHIRGINLDGTNPHELFLLDPNEWLLVGIVYDSAAGKLYWNNGIFASGTIRRSNLDGTDNELLRSGLRIPRGLAIDPVHGKLYFTDATPENNQILLKWANLDGTGEEVIFTGEIYVGQPRVDVTNERVYFGADGEIKSAALDGSDVRTVVTGVSLPGALDIDVANGYVYWIDFATHTNFVGRARLDNSEYTVLIDISQGENLQSSGLVDLILDRTHGHVYFANQDFMAGTTTIERADLDGSNHAVFFPSASGDTPSALALDVTPPQAVADCNGNTIPDMTEISQGQAEDCNENLVPDDCEASPCPTRTFHLDNGSNAASTSGFALGLPSEWQQYQPFDVPIGGWSVVEVGVDGYTVNYVGESGFSATLYPDNGSNRPDLTAPIASASGFNFRFDTNHENWIYRPISADLPEGRHWLGIQADAPLIYAGSINRGTSGLGAFSRGSSGNYVGSAFPLAVRLAEAVCHGHSGDVNGDLLTDGLDIQAFVDATISGSTAAADLCAADFSDSGTLDADDVPGLAAVLLAD